MLRELMNQLWPTERLESLRARAGRIAASRLSWPGCYSKGRSCGPLKDFKDLGHVVQFFEDLGDMA